MNPELDQTVKNLRASKEYKCKSCQGNLFDFASYLRIVPGLMLGKKTDESMPLDVFVCRKCQTPAVDLLPDFLRSIVMESNLPEPPKGRLIL